jgi:hypothetical protein
MMRRVALLVSIAAFIATVPGAAFASWTGNGGGSSWSRAMAMPAGNTPSAGFSGGNITLTWSTSLLPDSTPVAGYRVTRYPEGSSTPQTPGGTCNGTVATLGCTDPSVPSGRWVYTITPRQGSWLGAESGRSAAVSAGSSSFTLSSSTVGSLPAVLSGSLTLFASGEHVTFRLDDPTTGASLTGSTTPDPVPSNGSATVSVTIPNGTAEGSHSVYAVGDLGTVAGALITVDTVGPTVSAAAIAKSTGGTAGYLKQGGTYYVYANLNDANGLASATADVGTITSGTTAAPMTAGSYTADGVTYGWRTALLTASNPLAAGSKAFSVTGTDTLGHGATQGGFSVTIDNTVPAASDIQTTNVGSGTPGRPEAGDTVVFTFTEAVEPTTILAGWNGSSTPVTLRLIQQNGTPGDRVQVWDAGNTTQLPFGLIRLFNHYVTADRAFSGSTMMMSGSTITVTLGTPGGAVSTATGTGDISWGPTTTVTDRAGNACSNANAAEGGAADLDF